MQFQIRSVVLWPRNPLLAPRIVSFELGRLNIISGVSRTGKSAIIPIIDYCLGSQRCTIPTGVVRDAASWFGVVVNTREGDKLFARREPGLQQATDDMFMDEGPTISIPQTVAKNASRDLLKQRLDQLAGLSNLSFSSDDSEGGVGRPSFRDLSAFLFQPQNIVANPNVLFYKADTVEHRQKLRAIFPYVLGAVNAEVLALQHELQQLQKELRRKEGELLAVQQVSNRWIATLQASVAEARDLGFLPSADVSRMTREEMLDALRTVASLKRPERTVTVADIQESGEELQRLSAEEAAVSQELSTLGRRLSEMEQLRKSVSEFKGALALQKDRLQVSKWLVEHRSDGHECPICGNHLGESSPLLDELLRSLEATDRNVKQLGSIPPSFDREMERVRAGVSANVERLRGIRIRQTSLAKRDNEARAQHYSILNASRFIGRIEADLKTFESVGQDGALREEVGGLRDRVAALMRVVSAAGVEQRMRRALNTVNLNAGRLMPSLDAERPDDPITLSERELTIKVQGGNRDDYLWEIGSGSNWLSYHVAVSMALQQFFLTVKHCAVPNFIVYDQPSQVYFPRRLAGGDGDELDQTPWRDQDVAAVRRILSAMSGVVEASGKKLQIIVLDHASESVWGSITSVHSIEDWRDGAALVPRDWIAEL